MIRTARFFTIAAALQLAAATLAWGQDANIYLPIPQIETKLKLDTFRIADMRGSRFENDRTQRVVLGFGDSTMILVKWAKAAPGGQAFNNEPRYELAAYEFQKLFLEEPDYVVPPTILRAIPLSFYQTLDSRIKPTFGKTTSVLVVLQYWLSSVTGRDVFDGNRLKRDESYAYHLANANIFSYLVKHNDSNYGNFLISQDSTRPRVFAVDNGVAFSFEESDRGTEWRDLRVERLPARTVEKLRLLSKEDLRAALGVLAEFRIENGALVAAEPSENLDRNRGVRKNESIIQLGLTEREIGGVYDRLQRLLKRVDSGSLKTF